jgi:outer membrane protein assembly factor BamB
VNRFPSVPSCAAPRVVWLAIAAVLALASCQGTTRDTGRHTPPRPVPVSSAWSRPVPLGPSDLAADRDGTVVLSGNQRVSAFDPFGHEAWSRAVDGAGVNLDPPALDHDGVAVGAADRLVVLGRHDGALRWQADVPKEVGVVAFAHPRDREDVVVSSTYAGDVEARATSDGTVRWHLSRPGEVRARFAFGAEERTVLAVWSTAGPSVLRALDVTTGEVLWERVLEIGTSAPVVSGDAVVVGTGDGDYHATLEAFALRDGAPRWQVAVPASFEPELEPAVDGDSVVAVDQLGTVTAVDPAAGVERWHADLGAAVLRTRVVLGARAAVVSTGAGAVVWVERGSGRVLRRIEPVSEYARQVAGRPGQLLVAFGHGEAERVEAFPL